MLKRGCGYVTLWSARSFPESRGHILLSPNLWLGGGGGGGGTRLWFFTLDLPRCRLRVVTHSQEHKSTPLLLMGSSRALPGADLEDVVLMDLTMYMERHTVSGCSGRNGRKPFLKTDFLFGIVLFDSKVYSDFRVQGRQKASSEAKSQADTNEILRLFSRLEFL